MNASILLKLKITDDETYAIDLDIPTEAPKDEVPFQFKVEQEKNGKFTSKVLEVAVGATVNEKTHFYVAVAPPKSLLEEAGLGSVVEDLKVLVEEGKYDPEKEIFITGSQPNQLDTENE